MNKKDKIFKSFLEHEIISKKYGISKDKIPSRLVDGLNSNYAIVRAIALIVENTEGNRAIQDKALYNQITNFLNEKAI